MNKATRDARRRRLASGLEQGTASQPGADRPPDDSMTPPRAYRTDPDRGTGELGSEQIDPGTPLRAPDPEREP